MFTAGLVSLGADFGDMRNAMMAAAEKLGTAYIDLKKTDDGSSQLLIVLNSSRRHLAAGEAKEILLGLFDSFNIREKYRDFGLRILDILVKAERRAHREYNIVVHDNHNHSHNNSHWHAHDDIEEAFLHEAQDIVIDIIGAVMGMEELDIEPEADLLCPVSVGGGHIHFSHGTMSVPAPATSVILKEYGIEWTKGPIERELFTPTGAAILAALGAKVKSNIDLNIVKPVSKGLARGTKVLEIPPLELYMVLKKNL